MAEAGQWWLSWSAALRPYAVLLRIFTQASISADEFEMLYLQLYLNDPTSWDDETFQALDGLFFAVDDYCGNDELRREAGGIDEIALRQVAVDVFHRLEKLADLPH